MFEFNFFRALSLIPGFGGSRKVKTLYQCVFLHKVAATSYQSEKVESLNSLAWRLLYTTCYSLMKVMDCLSLLPLNGSFIPILAGGPVRRISGSAARLLLAKV